MLCPSCGKSVGEIMRFCDSCAAVKQQQDAERAAREAEVRAVNQQNPQLAEPEDVIEPGASGLDDETRLLLVKALSVALAVAVLLLIVIVVLV